MATIKTILIKGVTEMNEITLCPHGTMGLPVGLHFKTLKKLYSDAAGSTMS